MEKCFQFQAFKAKFGAEKDEILIWYFGSMVKEHQSSGLDLRHWKKSLNRITLIQAKMDFLNWTWPDYPWFSLYFRGINRLVQLRKSIFACIRVMRFRDFLDISSYSIRKVSALDLRKKLIELQTLLLNFWCNRSAF